MSKFPKPIELPQSVYKSRSYRNKQVIKYAQIGVCFRLAITAIEMTGFLLTNSAALYTDAISTLGDVISTVFLIVCMKLAQKPPDTNHPFGHGRLEPFGGLILGLILVALGLFMFVQQIFGVANYEEVRSIHPFAWGFPLLSLILLEICYRLIRNVAKRENSPALAADAVHYRIDGLTSLIAMIALLFVAFIPDWSGFIDYIGAIVISMFMITIGSFAFKENFHQLMDRTPGEPFFKRVREAAKRVEGVKGTEKIRIQSYGPDAHVDIDVEVAPNLSVDSAHKISQKVRAEIQKDWPAVRDVTVHIEPYYANDH